MQAELARMVVTNSAFGRASVRIGSQSTLLLSSSAGRMATMGRSLPSAGVGPMKFRCKWHRRASATRIYSAVITLFLVCGCARESASPEVKEARSICAAVPPASVIVIGELHGTAEAPRLFRELVQCRSKESANGLLVGLEIPPGALATVMELPTDATGAEKLRHLSKNGFWKNSKDGRTSIANLDLIEYLREGQRGGRLTVFAFDGRRSATDNFSEVATEALKDALSRTVPKGSNPDVLMLTGNGHATMAADNGSLGRGLADAGMRPYVIQTAFGTGGAWVCRLGECGVSRVNSGGCESHTSAETKIAESTVHTVCLPIATASHPAM